MYTYNARVLAVHDGDTVTLNVDVGFGWSFTDKFRLYGPDPSVPMGLNAPELNTPAGKDAQVYLQSMLYLYGNMVVLRSIKDHREKYGRLLAVLLVTTLDGATVNVNQKMIDSGNAVLEKY